jgi:hypothetical protein
MNVQVTQVLPDEKTQRIEVNADLVEDAIPWFGHSMLIMESGHEIEIEETPEQWAKLSEEK